MRSRGGGLSVCAFKRGSLDNGCYRSVPSMLLRSNIQSNSAQESMMRPALILVLPLAAALAACTPSNGSENSGKKGGGGHPGMGMPPPEVVVAEVKARSLP